MRVPKQFAVRTLAALIALAVGVLAGCATESPIKVTWDEREDLSRFSTWDWIDGDAVFVRGPFGDDTEVERQLSAVVARSLRERGLERAPGSGEVRVAALMVGTRTYEWYRRARAMQTLHSHHTAGGFEVQSDELEQRPVDRCRTAIYVTGPEQERMLWQAVLEQRHGDGCVRHIDDSVADLLDHFPGQSVAREDLAPAS